MSLKPQHEAFCRAYAAEPNGAEAARAAGYAEAGARHQAFKLLQRPDILERLNELGAEVRARRDDTAAALVASLDPVYRANLDAERYDRVLQVVELQARIGGILRGGSTIRPDPDGSLQDRVRDLVIDAYRRAKAAENYQASLQDRGEWTDEDEAEYEREYGNLAGAPQDGDDDAPSDEPDSESDDAA